MAQKFNEWPVIEIEGFNVEVVAVPMFAGIADLVAAEAVRLGADRAVFLHAVIGAGLAVIRAQGPPTPEPKFPGPVEPE